MPNVGLQQAAPNILVSKAKVVNKNPHVWKLSLVEAMKAVGIPLGRMRPLEVTTNYSSKFLSFLRMCDNVKDLRKEFNKEILGYPKPVTNDAFLGVEIEIEKCPNPGTFVFPGWKHDKDGSLKDYGAEFISVPMTPKDMFRHIPALFYTMKMLSKKGEEPQFSWRCGIHVHMNVRDYTVEEFYKLLLLYAIYEKPLFRFASSERANSVFCVPLQDTHYSIFLRDLFLKEDLLKVLNNWEKYCAVNLIRMRDYGTIEFRHFSGTKDCQQILTWINLLLCLGRAAKQIPTEDLFNTISQLNTTSFYDAFTKTIFPKELIHILWVNDFDKQLSKGITFAKECMSPNFLTADPFVKDRAKESGLVDYLAKKFGVVEARAAPEQEKEKAELKQFLPDPMNWHHQELEAVVQGMQANPVIIDELEAVEDDFIEEE